MNNIKKNIKKTYRKMYSNYIKIVHMRKIKEKIKNANFKIPQLNKLQKNELKEYYSKYNIKMNDLYHRYYYAVTGEFSPKYIPSWLYYNTIDPVLSNKSLVNAWTDKNYFDKLFPEIKFPEAIIHNMNGVFYDKFYKPISMDDAIEYILDEKEFVIKPSLSGGGGKGVKLINDMDKILEIFKEYSKDYVIQKKLVQHSEMAHFNESSVNIVRVISLLLDKEVKIISSSLRVGAPGQFLENHIDSEGRSMLTIGVNKDGKLKDVAYFANGEKKYKCLNGAEFSGNKIPKYEEMLRIIRKAHIRLPYFKMISWDMVVDKEGIPIVMEYNLKSQGIVYYQYVNGPLFGEYTDKILDIVKQSNI